MTARHLHRAGWSFTLFLLALTAASGCAATTSAWVESSVSSFTGSRDQAYNVTAHIGVELKRG